MKTKHILFNTVLLITFLVMGCKQSEHVTSAAYDNPLIQEWKGAYGGVPAFDAMKLENLKEALDKGMEVSLVNFNDIGNNKDSPTFDNTLVPIEKAREDLNRVLAYYGIWSSNLSSPEFRKIQEEMAPRMAEFNSQIIQNEKLFSRLKTVYDASQEKPLPADQQRVVNLYYEEFVMRGAALDAASKARYAEIEKELSTLYTKFANNVLADEENYVTYLTRAEISGLPESFIKSAGSEAVAKGKSAMYAVTNTRSSIDPFLTYSNNRAAREKVWKTFYARGDNGDEFDNNALITKILQLRHERVGLLGYENYAQWRLQDRMAKTPERAMDMMKAVWPAATARVREEVADMQKIANKDNVTIAPWDYRYYAEKVRTQKYDLNSDEVKQYLQLDKLQDAMFYVAGELFNFDFKPVPEGSVPVFHEDVKVWEVSDKTTGKHIGLWYLDPYARQGKRSGAWATTYRNHTTFDGKKNVLSSNNSNFVKPAPGEPLLISWSDATTFFHEFGHALHFLSSNVKYPKLNGGVRDYTEFHSQLLERWLSTDRVIKDYFLHYKTGKPMPETLVKKIKTAATFNSGFNTTEYLASALMDMYYHTTDPANLDPRTFEKETLASLNMPGEVVMRHRSTQFSHVFSGEGYATAYYGYMWADVLTADAAEMFLESPDGFYNKAIAEKMVKYLFAPRNAVDPAEAYRLFRGRDANLEPLMRDRGFPVK